MYLFFLPRVSSKILLNLCLFTQGETLPHLQFSPSGGKGERRWKAVLRMQPFEYPWVETYRVLLLLTGPTYMPIHHNRRKILNIRNWFLNYGGFFPTWIWLLDFRSCHAWSLKGKIDCFCGLSQFRIYGGISLYYSCWRPTCLHCSESTLQDTAPTVSHWEILPKAGKRQQAKNNIHSQLMNAEIKTNKIKYPGKHFQKTN